MKRILFAVAALGMLAMASASQAQAPGNERPSVRPESIVDDGTPKMCVREPRGTYKIEYTSVVKVYCKSHKSCLDILLHRECSDCSSRNDCELWRKCVLVKKVVDGKDKMKCVPVDAPGCATAPDCAVPPGGPVPPGTVIIKR
jgi:hypothetical protein